MDPFVGLGLVIFAMLVIVGIGIDQSFKSLGKRLGELEARLDRDLPAIERSVDALRKAVSVKGDET
jgi:hypothetical protein